MTKNFTENTTKISYYEVTDKRSVDGRQLNLIGNVKIGSL